MSTLYVTSDVARVSLESKHLSIAVRDGADGERNVRKVPLHDIDRVAVLGGAGVTVTTIRALLRREIPVYMLTRGGLPVGSFTPARDGDAMVRISQYKAVDESVWMRRQAGLIVRQKLLNMRRVLQKLASSVKDCDAAGIAAVLDRLLSISRDCEAAESQDTLRGLEGAGTAAYFGQLKSFFPEDTPFKGRSRRPPRDEANALLSLAYTLVLGEMRGALTSVGLDPCIGFYHAIEYGRPALALDLIEPLRAPLCDLLTLRLLNLQILGAGDFQLDEDTGGYMLKPVGLKRFFLHYEKRMSRLFREPGSDSHTDFRRVIQSAAGDYAKAIRGNRDVQPFAMP